MSREVLVATVAANRLARPEHPRLGMWRPGSTRSTGTIEVVDELGNLAVTIVPED
jgi:hypothetical protein